MENENRTIKQYEIYKDNDDKPYLKITREFDFDLNPCVFHYARDIDGYMIMMDHLYDMGNYEAEHIFSIAINSDKHVVGIYLLGIGNQESVSFDKRNLGIFLLLTGATECVIVHNHTNDVYLSSNEDKVATLNYKYAVESIGIKYLGLYIIGKSGYSNVDDEDSFKSWLDEDMISKREMICV